MPYILGQVPFIQEEQLEPFQADVVRRDLISPKRGFRAGPIYENAGDLLLVLAGREARGPARNGGYVASYGRPGHARVPVARVSALEPTARSESTYVVPKSRPMTMVCFLGGMLNAPRLPEKRRAWKTKTCKRSKTTERGLGVGTTGENQAPRPLHQRAARAAGRGREAWTGCCNCSEQVGNGESFRERLLTHRCRDNSFPWGPICILNTHCWAAHFPPPTHEKAKGFALRPQHFLPSSHRRPRTPLQVKQCFSLFIFEPVSVDATSLSAIDRHGSQEQSKTMPGGAGPHRVARAGQDSTAQAQQ